MNWHQLHDVAPAACPGTSCMSWHQLHVLATAACPGTSIMPWHQLHGSRCIPWHQLHGLASVAFPVTSNIPWYQLHALAPAAFPGTSCIPWHQLQCLRSTHISKLFTAIKPLLTSLTTTLNLLLIIIFDFHIRMTQRFIDRLTNLHPLNDVKSPTWPEPKKH